MSTTFADLGVPRPLCDTLRKRGITEPFPIQAAAIADALAGRDVSGKAPTGSGKTLAFGLPLLTNVEPARPRRPKALILAPTRELAEQISVELQPLARVVDRWVAVVYGGVGYGPQKNALRKGVDVLVATPGRLEDLIDQRVLQLGDVNLVVVDEADRMADMGFVPAVRRILDQTSPRRQTMLFSATLDGEVAQLAKRYQTNPVRREAEAVETNAPDAEHHFWLVERDQRIDRTVDVIESGEKVIVFTRTRHGADRLARQLGKRGVDAVAMHGGRNQGQRRRALSAFTKGRAAALIATDVAARGIHVDDVSTVLHFDPPHDAKDYVHRSGRTARAGAGGTVVSLVLRDQRKAIGRIQRDLGIDAPIGPPVSLTAQIPGGGRSDSPGDKRSKEIFVGNLPWKTTETDLHELFSTHGEVVSTTVARRKGKSKGYGFVEMPHNQAIAAIDSLSRAELEGRRLQVRAAR
ncbi:MAG: DEAD/DEAH box helicase [Acidimicrobiia bacterium]|jgi:superfamily II DNA/RNA helicase